MHGCLSTWLWFIIVMNILGIILTLMIPSFTAELELPSWYMPVSIAATVLVVGFAIALLKWKAWGFWGLVAMECVSVFISILETGNYISIIGGVMGVAILVALLNMGGANKAWNNLE